MSHRLPAISPHKALRAFQKAGWTVARQSGSHVTLENENVENILTIPIHKGRDLKRGLLHGLIKSAGLTIDEFLELL